MKHSIPSVLTIAGTDPTGGAGIQADLKAFQEREVYGMSVVTSVIAQNTLGVQGVEHLPTQFIEQQMESVLTDISPDVIKTGMVASAGMMEVIAETIKRYSIRYVIDPVMIAKSGDHLMNADAKQTMIDQLIPLATVVTPNIPEAEVLLSESIHSLADAEDAARRIVHELGANAAVVKGGHHVEGDAIDVLYDGSAIHRFPTARIATKHTHGTGCTYSAVITAELAKGYSIYDSVHTAKKFITDAIRYSLQIGKGNGPTNHWGHRLQGIPEVNGRVLK
ncbi:bifunctional hydroxymethylpyrimidine kinase/phosphomethylpyrimidine kinase [Virgibacillus phasianinus]|uniref:Hydroxymethylpyrimidine/phosphomethylpyrimidine kinase n=1 Tax=Virgibacillus phasianinus TaxID=2017483 RepID=A0A220U0R8_9BACI|nr:bifunctional hydroxymethylpyrimidine kinase/phosphomethylpyrimidine kinase [Virgibacillus phasianinus]ASK61523.1 bifunctional hydroxymethylpyrimidine kinase/phosphomethylpyrimidine kinase [Virgibacillus phasianinus]